MWDIMKRPNLQIVGIKKEKKKQSKKQKIFNIIIKNYLI